MVPAVSGGDGDWFTQKSLDAVLVWNGLQEHFMITKKLIWNYWEFTEYTDIRKIEQNLFLKSRFIKAATSMSVTS